MSDKPLKGIAAKLQKKTADFGERVEKNTRPSIADQPPITMPGQLGAFRLEAQKYQDQIDQLKQQLADAKAAGGGNAAALQAELDAARMKLAHADERLAEAEAALLDRPPPGQAAEASLDLIDEVAGRRRNLTPDEYASLRENIRQHDLITPVTLKKKADGRFEVVSGHNRVAIFRELGWSTIPYVLDRGDDEGADERAFFANLLHPDLPDIEKYLGLEKLIEEKPELDGPVPLATYTGLPEATVRKLLRFGDLPVPAFNLLRATPGALGANAAAELARLSDGNEERVTDAIRKLIESGGTMTQQQAVDLAKPKAAPKPTPTKPAEIKIKSGKSTYCSMVAANKVVRIAFASEEEAMEAQAALRAVLEKRAERQKR